MCAFNLTEADRVRCLVHILAVYDLLQGFQGFKFEQEPVFSYKFHDMVFNAVRALGRGVYRARAAVMCRFANGGLRGVPALVRDTGSYHVPMRAYCGYVYRSSLARKSSQVS